MKRITTAGLFVAMLFFAAVHTASAQSNKAVNMFKEHINNVVQKVKVEENPQEKRELLNASFDKLLNSFNKVESMKVLSQADQSALNQLQNNITEKRNELNGLNGYKRVQNSQLNNFANFVQQDLEQADSTVTISVTVLLLIIIILLLL